MILKLKNSILTKSCPNKKDDGSSSSSSSRSLLMKTDHYHQSTSSSPGQNEPGYLKELIKIPLPHHPSSSSYSPYRSSSILRSSSSWFKSFLRSLIKRSMKLVPSLLLLLFIVSLIFVTLMQIAVIHSHKKNLFLISSSASSQPLSSSSSTDDNGYSSGDCNKNDDQNIDLVQESLSSPSNVIHPSKLTSSHSFYHQHHPNSSQNPNGSFHVTPISQSDPRSSPSSHASSLSSSDHKSQVTSISSSFASFLPFFRSSSTSTSLKGHPPQGSPSSSSLRKSGVEEEIKVHPNLNGGNKSSNADHVTRGSEKGSLDQDDREKRKTDPKMMAGGEQTLNSNQMSQSIYRSNDQQKQNGPLGTSAPGSPTSSSGVTTKKIKGPVLKIEALLDRNMIPSRELNTKILQNYVNSARIREIFTFIQNHTMTSFADGNNLLIPRSFSGDFTSQSPHHSHYHNNDNISNSKEPFRHTSSSSSTQTSIGSYIKSLKNNVASHFSGFLHLDDLIGVSHENENHVDDDDDHHQGSLKNLTKGGRILRKVRKQYPVIKRNKTPFITLESVPSSTQSSNGVMVSHDAPLDSDNSPTETYQLPTSKAPKVVMTSDPGMKKKKSSSSSDSDAMRRASNNIEITRLEVNKKDDVTHGRTSTSAGATHDDDDSNRLVSSHIGKDLLQPSSSSGVVVSDHPSVSSLVTKESSSDRIHSNLLDLIRSASSSFSSSSTSPALPNESSKPLLSSPSPSSSSSRRLPSVTTTNTYDNEKELNILNNDRKKLTNDNNSSNDYSISNPSSQMTSSSASTELMLPTDDKPLCPQVPPLLMGRITVDMDPILGVNMSNILKLNPGIRSGGRYSPPTCSSRHKVAIIIPFRDRERHLSILLYHLHPILQRQLLSYQIFVVEQAGHEIFNKGVLMNAGVKESLKMTDFHCFIFHDVDLIPEDDRNLYTCPEYPRHMSPGVDKFNYYLPYSYLVGGVFAISKDHLISVNGYSNLYWGWGGEDDDMSHRLKTQHLKIIRPPGAIGRYTMIKHDHKKETESPWNVRQALLTMAKRRAPRDGLSSVKYILHNITSYPLYTHILLEIGHVHKWHFPSPNKLVLHF